MCECGQPFIDHIDYYCILPSERDYAGEKMIKALKIELEDVKNHTTWNAIPKYTPAQVEPLVLHIEKCHVILREISGIADWQAPFRIPAVRESAIELLKEIK